MKKVLLSALGLSAALLGNAQELLTTTPQNKTIVLEEFTGYKCQYCPDGHRRANAMAAAYPGKVVLVNIHAGGYADPGSSSDPDYRTPYGDPMANYYNVTGYPSGMINRHNFGGGLVLDRGQWAGKGAEILTQASPVNIGMSTTWNETTRELSIHVEMYYTGDSPASENFLNIALLENGIVSRQVDSDNGGWVNDYTHNHMLRDFITGQWGDTVTTTTQGTMVVKDFTYVVSEEFVIENCEVAAYITESKNEIYAGTQVHAVNGSTAFIGELTSNSQVAVDGALNQASAFNFNYTSGFSTDEDFNISVTSNTNWDASITAGGNTFSGAGDVTFTAGQSQDFAVNITPTTSGIGEFVVTVSSTTLPGAPVKIEKFYVVSDVDVLLLNHDDASDWADVYTNAFDVNGISAKVSATNVSSFMAITGAGALSNVSTIYYNIGWTFPGLTPDLVAVFGSVLDKGGNLFIAGQDVAWETFDEANSPYDTPEARAFMTDYLHVSFKSDGGSAARFTCAAPFDTVKADILRYYGNNYYPDEVKATQGGLDLMTYNTGAYGGVAYQGDFKTVYLGIGLEMFKSTAARNDMMRLTDEFFNGNITVGMLEQQIKAMFGAAYPMPASDMITVELNDINENTSFEMMDMTGRVVYTTAVSAGSQNVQVNVANMPAGTYLYRLVNGNQVSETKKIQVAH